MLDALSQDVIKHSDSWHVDCISSCEVTITVNNMNRGKAQIVEITETNFNLEVLMSKQPVLVAFLAPWSLACQIFHSAIEEVAAACAESVKIVKVNADNNPDLGLEYGIQAIPTLAYFVDGNLRAKVVGTASKEAILSKLESVLHVSIADSQIRNRRKQTP
jgi:thioredoxin 1